MKLISKRRLGSSQVAAVMTQRLIRGFLARRFYKIEFEESSRHLENAYFRNKVIETGDQISPTPLFMNADTLIPITTK